MLIFKDFFRKLAKKEDVEVLDETKNRERDFLKNQWIDQVINDTYLDDIIFGYTDIFPVDEQTALANIGSKDHLDILVAAGINYPLQKANDNQSLTNAGSSLNAHALPSMN
jgi:hypothetical protein